MASRKVRKRVCYLAGPMEFTTEEKASGWRVRVAGALDKMGVHSIDPVKEEFRISPIPASQMSLLKEMDINKYIEIMRDKIVPMDIGFVEQCTDLVVKHCGEKTAGTAGEMTYARVLGKPVYLVAGVPLKEIPGWVLGCATHIFESEKSFLDFFAGTL